MSNNDNDKWKAIMREADIAPNNEKKPRRIKRLAKSLRRTIEKKLEERKERKEIYKAAYKRAEKAAIITKARREARARHAPRIGRRGRTGGILASGGLFDLPAGFTGATLFGPAPKKRRAKAKKRKKTTGRRRPRKVVYY